MFNGQKVKSAATVHCPNMADQVKTTIEHDITSGQHTENKTQILHAF
jgi:hypothetical protein